MVAWDHDALVAFVGHCRRRRRSGGRRLALDSVGAVRALRHHGLVHELLPVWIGDVVLPRQRIVMGRGRAHRPGADAPAMLLLLLLMVVEAGDARAVGASAAAGAGVPEGRVGGSGGGSPAAGVALTASTGLAAAVARRALDAVLYGPVLQRPLGRALRLAGDLVHEPCYVRSVHLCLFAFALDEAL